MLIVSITSRPENSPDSGIENTTHFVDHASSDTERDPAPADSKTNPPNNTTPYIQPSQHIPLTRMEKKRLQWQQERGLICFM